MINIFGAGFVGKEFAKLYPDAQINARDDYEIKTDDVVYFISTVDNYNVFTDPYLDIETNLVTLIKVLESGKSRPNLTFNFISSWFVYGMTDLPAREDSYCNPKGFYSITKRAAEQLIVSYCETFNLKYRIIRLGNIIGVGDGKVSAKKNALQFLIGKIKNNEPINLYDRGEPIRDYIDVIDVARAIKLIIEQGPVNDIYNVGNGEPVQLKTVVDYVIRATNSTTAVSFVEAASFHKIVQVKDFYLDVAKLKQLGYQRTISLWDSLDRIIAA
jgi:nucleoside-diphosphate-sugar epimerase